MYTTLTTDPDFRNFLSADPDLVRIGYERGRLFLATSNNEYQLYINHSQLKQFAAFWNLELQDLEALIGTNYQSDQRNTAILLARRAPALAA